MMFLDNVKYGNESLKKGKQDFVVERVSDLMVSVFNRVSRSLDDDIEFLKEKVGFDFISELLLIDENDLGIKRRWEVVEKMKEGNILVDILDIYECELERLYREKSVMEVLVNYNEGDDQFVFDIIL